ncbi:hypothetical protein AB3N59_20275 (plasmid) [Leptospira sp. WS92.C1]
MKQHIQRVGNEFKKPTFIIFLCSSAIEAILQATEKASQLTLFGQTLSYFSIIGLVSFVLYAKTPLIEVWGKLKKEDKKNQKTSD